MNFNWFFGYETETGVSVSHWPTGRDLVAAKSRDAAEAALRERFPNARVRWED